MPLFLQPAVEADLEHIVDIQFEAVAPDPFSQVMFPTGITPEARVLAVDSSRRDFNDPVIKYIKVVDIDLDSKAVAFAKWHIYKEERTESEWMKAETRDYGEGSNREMLDEFFGQITEKRQKHLGGQPHCLLSLLSTHPDHQQRGAGSQLLKWGTDLADEAGICCYLVASSKGYPLYCKKGFEDLDFIDIDTTKWGGNGIIRNVCMIRPCARE